MSKIACNCGYVMNNNTMEEEFLYDLLPIKGLMEIIHKWKKLREDVYPDSFTNIYNQYSKEVYICPSCGRILVASDKDPNVFDSVNTP